MKTLEQIQAFLATRVHHQEKPVRVAAESLARAFAGVARAGEPLDNFLFLGPTGVGKTELTKAIAETWSVLHGGPSGEAGWKSRLARFDMGDYKDSRSHSFLIGTSTSEQGHLGREIDRLNSVGGGVMLMDEIEKADKTVMDLFLALMDEGRASMSNGDTKDATRCFIVLTSNLGAHLAEKGDRLGATQMRRAMMGQLATHFRPEMIGRFNQENIVIFGSLGFEAQASVTAKMLDSYLRDVALNTGCKAEFEDEQERATVIRWLINRGYDRRLGARPMRQTITRDVGNAMAQLFLGRAAKPAKVVLAVKAGNLVAECAEEGIAVSA